MVDDTYVGYTKQLLQETIKQCKTGGSDLQDEDRTHEWILYTCHTVVCIDNMLSARPTGLNKLHRILLFQ